MLSQAVAQAQATYAQQSPDQDSTAPLDLAGDSAYQAALSLAQSSYDQAVQVADSDFNQALAQAKEQLTSAQDQLTNAESETTTSSSAVYALALAAHCTGSSPPGVFAVESLQDW